MKSLLAAAALALALAVGFFAGAWWHAELALEPPAGPSPAPIALPREPPARREPAPVPEPIATAPTKVDPRCADVSLAVDVVTRQLTQTRAMLGVCEQKVVDREAQRLQREGFPIPADSQPKQPRFEPEALRGAVSGAFTEARVPGRVDGLDCTEWPCIVYGRIRGTEDEMEKLEGARALAAYEGDVLSVQLWVVTDEAAHAAPLPGLPGRPEQTLFAFAWYPRGLERALSENLDRRLRSRTAELWNLMSPSDETGR